MDTPGSTPPRELDPGSDPELRYQRIRLSDGQVTDGEDRSATAEQIFPASLSGQSVLDVGCALGAMCHEALRRGATSVTGLDVDPAKVARARAIAADLGAAINFRIADLDHETLDARYDHVLALNVLHHARYPIRALHTLAVSARRRLALEIAGLDDDVLKRQLGGGWMQRRVRSAAARESTILITRNQTFLSRAALRTLLMERWRLFAKIAFHPSPKPGRFIVLADRRRIDELVIVAGPSCVGKTHLLDRFRAGDGAACEALGIPSPTSWDVANLGRIHERSDAYIPRLLLHVDTMRTRMGEARTPARSHVEDLVASADSVRVVTLRASASTLGQRLTARKKSHSSFGEKRAIRLAALYASQDIVDEHYAMWTGYCTDRDLQHTTVDVNQS